MKLKTVEVNGKSYAEIDASGLPVYVHDDGQEVGFDAVQAVGKISSLNGEAKSHREAKEAAEAGLAKFAKIGDPAKALEALEMMTKIDQKKLIDAGAVDQVKADRGIHFRSLTDSIDTSTPAGRFFFHVMSALAEMERELIVERTRAGLAAAREQGRVGGRRRVMTTEVVERCRRMLENGATRQQIADVIGVGVKTIYKYLPVALTREPLCRKLQGLSEIV